MPAARSLPEPAFKSEQTPAGVQCLVTAHNGPQVTIHYKRAEVLGQLRALLESQLRDRWTPSPREETYALRSAVDGASSQLQVHKEHARKGGGLRGEIKGLSRQSRNRLMHSLASINRSAFDPRQVLFMTLTYHNTWSEDPGDQYDQLRRWFKRMNRRWPGLVVQWRKEWQARLAPHWHMVVYTPPAAIPVEGENWTFLEDALEQWIDVACGPRDSDFHMYLHSLKARLCESWDGTIAYASKTEKYVSKTETLLPVNDQGEVLPTGRLWGTLGNKDNLPVSFDTESLTRTEYIRIRRVFRRLLRPKDRRWTRRHIPRGDLTNLRALVNYRTATKLLAWLRC